MSGKAADVGDAKPVDDGDGEMGVGGSDAYVRGVSSWDTRCVGLNDAGRRRRQPSAFDLPLRAMTAGDKAGMAGKNAILGEGIGSNLTQAKMI